MYQVRHIYMDVFSNTTGVAGNHTHLAVCDRTWSGMVNAEILDVNNKEKVTPIRMNNEESNLLFMFSLYHFTFNSFLVKIVHQLSD